MKKKHSRKRRLLWTCVGLLLGGLLAWSFSERPLVGGGKLDGIRARWVKHRVYSGVAPLDEQGFSRLTPENASGWYSVFREPIQTLEDYRASQPARPTAQRKTIVLQPLGAMTAQQSASLNDLKEFCAAFFGLPVRIAPPLSLDAVSQSTRARHKQNRQYDAGKIIDVVLSPRLPADAAAYLGITMSDLWSGDLNYVFGVGSFERRLGVYSLARYSPEFWGGKRAAGDDSLALRRSCQVLGHEAGHMFGLEHCVLYKCAMNGSNSLGDADSTPLDFCPVCHRKLLWNLDLDGAKRYAALLAFYQKHELSNEATWTKARLQRWHKVAATEN